MVDHWRASVIWCSRSHTRSPGSNLLERLCPLLVGKNASGEPPDVGPFRDKENVFDFGTTDELWGWE